MSTIETERRMQPLSMEEFKVVASVSQKSEEELLNKLILNSEKQDFVQFVDEQEEISRRETAEIIAVNPALNLLTVTEALSRYERLMKNVRLPIDDMIEIQGELSSLPLDFAARVYKIETLNQAYLRANPALKMTRTVSEKLGSDLQSFEFESTEK